MGKTRLYDDTRFKVWLLAARPKTLPAAIAPVLVGSAIAYHDGLFQTIPALLALVAALLIQIGTNLANDLFDYKKGADNESRLGPLRVTAAGLLTPKQVATGMGIVFGLAALAGIFLTIRGGWPILIIGVLSIAAGIGYTGGPYPLGYNGLGDVFVFIFFGLVAVMGTYYVQALSLSTSAFLGALAIGCLATAILVVNNLRDINTDREAGKKTLAVRIGSRATRAQYVFLVITPLLVATLIWYFGFGPIWVLVVWILILRIIPLVRMVYRENGRPLNVALAGTGRLELEFAVLLSIGLFIP